MLDFPSLFRHATAALAALTITFGLFYFMQFLISMGSGQGANINKGNVIEFVRLKRDSDLQLRKRELPKKEKPPEQPPPPELQMSAPDAADANVMAIAAPDLGINPDVGGMNLGAAPSDTDTVPLVRVPPQYPVRASERGIEGWVVVEFTIATNGTVKDPFVVDSQPARIFDRAALRAVQKWKYKPKIVDGSPVERSGIQVKFPFELENN
jgi:protein TonB